MEGERSAIPSDLHALDTAMSSEQSIAMDRSAPVLAKLARLLGLGIAVLVAVPVKASELVGPARFCGYAPIIDLLPGEKITTLGGGIHSGSFRWEGAFGSFVVSGIGWAGPPKGRMLTPPAAEEPARFEQRRVKQGYQVAIWNGANGAAYFTSPGPFGAQQLRAIKRVRLFEEGQEPSGCKLRTIFAWE